jgi:hypothetical protein
MSTGLSNKYGCIFFIKIMSHTFSDKEAHRRIIYEYILKLEITESNNMEGFQRELSRHIKQYDSIQVNAWKKITTHLICQYHKINSPPFQTGFNIRVLAGPKQKTKYELICTLFEWTSSTCHDLIASNLWPKPETSNNHEINTMPVHEKPMGGEVATFGVITKIQQMQNHGLSQQLNKQLGDRSPAPTNNVWTRVSHVFLPTFWCPKCNKWTSHHESLHDD